MAENFKTITITAVFPAFILGLGCLEFFEYQIHSSEDKIFYQTLREISGDIHFYLDYPKPLLIMGLGYK